MKFSILPSGYRDLANARDFYERQSQGLGSYFLEAIFTEIESLRLHAGVHRKVFGFHRILAARFPYAIYYKVGSAKRPSTVSWIVAEIRRRSETI